MTPPNNRNNSLIENIIGATVGALIQVIITILLTTTVQPNLLIALGIALPVALSGFLGFRALYNRWSRQKRETSFPINQVDTPLKTNSDLTPQIDKHKISEDVLAVIEEMGVISATNVLTKSKYEPIECMKQTRRKLLFMGLLASKWVVEPHVRAEFRNFLQRVQTQGGAVHFLLINPNCTPYKQLKNELPRRERTGYRPAKIT